jgi:hypothetical protein
MVAATPAMIRLIKADPTTSKTWHEAYQDGFQSLMNLICCQPMNYEKKRVTEYTLRYNMDASVQR